MNAYLSLAKALRWQGNDWKFICEEYNSFLRDRLIAYASQSGTVASELRALIDCLSLDEKSSFVCYPYVADVLHPRTRLTTDESLWPLLAHAFSYLAWLGKIDRQYMVIQWPNAGIRKPMESIPLECRLNKPLPLAVDPCLEFPGMTGGNDLRILDDATLAMQTARVRHAESLIREWCPEAWRLSAIGTEILSLRKEVSEASRFGSASFRGLAGLNLLINPHLVSTGTLADAIVHEAIHSVLYQVEPVFGDFFRDQEAAKNETPSPWTGRLITVDNVAQACFVWSGLFYFWKAAAQCENSEASGVAPRARMSMIAKGFAALELRQLEGILNDCMFAAISEMRSELVEDASLVGV
jgi:hypothetical protein